MQTLVSRETSPLGSAVLSVTLLRAGHAYNVIPDVAEFGGTIRCDMCGSSQPLPLPLWPAAWAHLIQLANLSAWELSCTPLLVAWQVLFFCIAVFACVAGSLGGLLLQVACVAA